MKFIRKNFEPGLILAGRNELTDYAEAIRITLGCWSNHNALSIMDPTLGWCFGEATPPHSRLTTLEEYEELMNKEGYKVRLWKVKDVDDDSRAFASEYFRTHLLGVPYPRRHSMAKLAIFRFVNNLPWKLHMRGRFCTELVQEAWTQASKIKVNDPYRKPNGKMKKNPTPRTTENRLIAGVLVDVTDRMIDPTK